jgi:hypothetical protein
MKNFLENYYKNLKKIVLNLFRRLFESHFCVSRLFTLLLLFLFLDVHPVNLIVFHHYKMADCASSRVKSRYHLHKIRNIAYMTDVTERSHM